MKMAAFNAMCPYEIGDKINAVKEINGQMFSAGVAIITDIACVHYIKSGKIVFVYELDNSGKYVPMVDLRREKK